MTPEQDRDRAIKAKAILDNPMFGESFDLVRTEIIRRIEACALSDTQTAEDLRRCLRLLNDVKLTMTMAINSGKLADFRLAQKDRSIRNQLTGFFK